MFHGNLPISGVEHMPTPCNYVHTWLQRCQGLDRARHRGRGDHGGRKNGVPAGASSSSARVPPLMVRPIYRCFRMALAVVSSVTKPLIRRPFSAAAIAGTLAGPTAAPMVRDLAGTCGGMLVRR